MMAVRVGAAVVFATALGAANASAQEKTAAITGIDKIHTQARVGGKVCMMDHEHFGEGTLPSRRGAEAAAIRSWGSFTTWEYGSVWGKYSLAVAKKMTCTSTAGAWTCQTTARPCRPGK